MFNHFFHVQLLSGQYGDVLATKLGRKKLNMEKNCWTLALYRLFSMYNLCIVYFLKIPQKLGTMVHQNDKNGII